MKRTRFSVEQIVAVLKQAEMGTHVAALNERSRNSDSFANALNQHLNAISQA